MVAQLLLGDEIWGIEKYVISLMERLPMAGVDAIAICAHPGPVYQALVKAGFQTHLVPMRGYHDLTASFQISQICRQWGVDILHAHTGLDSYLGVFAKFLSHTPMIMSVHFQEPAYMSLPFPVRPTWQMVQIARTKQSITSSQSPTWWRGD